MQTEKCPLRVWWDSPAFMYLSGILQHPYRTQCAEPVGAANPAQAFGLVIGVCVFMAFWFLARGG